MANIRCPKCGKENPESLTVCQFCQAPLASDATMRIGDKPTKKDTGELEPILPDWLRDVRKQARDLAEEDASQAATLPRIQKVEPPDLLAGLASQSAHADDEDVPDWLASLSPRPAEKSVSPPAPAQPEPADLLGSKSEPQPKESPASTPPERDELSEWFAKASEEPVEPFSLESGSQSLDEGWNFKAQASRTSQESASPPADEDLSWLRNLEAEAKKTGELSRPKQGEDRSAGSDAPAQEDLSWLDQLGALPASDIPGQEAAQSGEDLSWLNELSALPPVEDQKPSTPQDDLSWLHAFAESPAPGEPATPASQEELGWLDALGKDSQPPELPHIAPFSPRQTAPLDDKAGPPIPDWLKSATEEPSLPLGPEALNKIREDQNFPPGTDEAFSRALFGAAFRSEEEKAVPSQPGAAPGDASPLFSQDVSSIFTEDLPDWLSNPEAASDQQVEDIGIHAEGGEALSPADLPSWVQAMRPVEAVIAEATPGVDDLPVEREGPLAGLKGVIPAVAIGALRRPQPIPLKLQATAEQQASAAILEQILLGETTPRPVVSAPVMISQRRLRWVIAGLLLLVLGAVLFTGTQVMPVSPSLPPVANDVYNAVANIADNAPVLVILDYEPALAGEMEAVSGPVLDHMVRLHYPYLAFITTSPSGNGLVERLLVNADISQADGAPYIAEQNYRNMGYLPGGSSGVQAFLQAPQTAAANTPVLDSSEYAAILLLTDQAESARVWVEQLQTLKQSDPAYLAQPLLAVASAQAGPMLQPYVYSKQISGMVSGLPIAARYEFQNGNRPGMARSYWDAFGVGIMMAVFVIVIGSLWSGYSGIRARRAEVAEE